MTTQEVLSEIIARLEELEDRIETNTVHHGEQDSITVVDDLSQVQNPYPNQLVIVTGDTTGPAGGRLLRYDQTAAGFLPIN